MYLYEERHMPDHNGKTRADGKMRNVAHRGAAGRGNVGVGGRGEVEPVRNESNERSAKGQRQFITLETTMACVVTRYGEKGQIKGGALLP